MRICLVSGSHLSSNPRLVKEADALQAAGHQVHVVAGRNYPPSDPLDATILRRATWTSTIVDYHGGPRAKIQRVLRQVARRLARTSLPWALRFADRAHHPAAGQLAAAASRVPADLFIGHTLVGLTAAARAAQRQQVRLGFDAEDFHSLETEAASTDPLESRIIRHLEQSLLARCQHLTAAAPLMGAAYAKTYGVRQPVTVLNVFPLNEAPAAAPPVHRSFTPDHPARLYWVSQTIGPGRGIEPLLAILALMRTPVTLSLRGTISPDYASALQAVATAAGYLGRLELLPSAPPAEMARLAAPHDLGLAIEPLYPENRHLCLSNKIFTYLLAGLPVAHTPTRAQLDFARQLGPAAVLVDFADIPGTARRLDTYFSDADRQSAARSEAWRLAQTRYNWDFEQRALLDAVNAALR